MSRAAGHLAASCLVVAVLVGHQLPVGAQSWTPDSRCGSNSCTSTGVCLGSSTWCTKRTTDCPDPSGSITSYRKTYAGWSTSCYEGICGLYCNSNTNSEKERVKSDCWFGFTKPVCCRKDYTCCPYYECTKKSTTPLPSTPLPGYSPRPSLPNYRPVTVKPAAKKSNKAAKIGGAIGGIVGAVVLGVLARMMCSREDNDYSAPVTVVATTVDSATNAKSKEHVDAASAATPTTQSDVTLVVTGSEAATEKGRVVDV